MKGKKQKIVGTVFLLFAVVTVIVSFLKPVLLLGSWKNYSRVTVSDETSPLELEDGIRFTLFGECYVHQKVLNIEEQGYVDDIWDCRYSVVDGKIRFYAMENFDGCFHVSPTTLRMWDENYPNQPLEYQRDGIFYPSVVLWSVAGVFLVAGVLLLILSGKKTAGDTVESVFENQSQQME